MRKRDKIVVGLAITIAALYIGIIYQESQLVVTANKLYQINQQIQEIKKENTMIKDEILTAASFQTIENKAIKQGFHFNTTQYYLLP